MLAVLRVVVLQVAEVEQGAEVLVGDEDDAAAIAAVASGRAALVDELLAAERDRAVAAIAGLHLNADLIDELHRNWTKRQTGRGDAASRTTRSKDSQLFGEAYAFASGAAASG